MKLDDLRKKLSDGNLNFSIDPADKEGDGVLEQLDKIFLYALASGALENGFRLPRLSDCDDLGVSRGSLFLFYNELADRIDYYLGKKDPRNKEEEDKKDKNKEKAIDPNNPATQFRKYEVNLKYTEECFSLIEKVFVEGLDLKKARTNKKDKDKEEPEQPTDGIYAEIQSVIAQCSAIRYPKQKIIDYFNREMEKKFFDSENRALLAKITCAFQWNHDAIRSLADVVQLRGRGDDRLEGDGVKESILVTDIHVPYADLLDEHEWDVEYFTPENGLSYSNLNFSLTPDPNGERYKKYDAIYCPDHSFAENLLSAKSIYNFLLTAKNKLKKGGRLIINLFDPDARYVEQSKEKNQKKRFDLLLDKDGVAVDRADGRIISQDTENNKKIFDAAKELLPKKAKTDWDGERLSFTKMSSFIHCDMVCEDLKRSLGIDPTQQYNEDGTEVKVWSFAEELKYTITVPNNADLPDIPKDCKFTGYLDYQSDRLSKSLVRRDMLEYVLIDPTNFKRILNDCGFEVDILGADLKPYDPKVEREEKNIFYVCWVK